MDVGAFLVLEGALVLGLVVARTACLRIADPAMMPTAVRRRVARMTRWTPGVTALSVALIVLGLASQIATGS